MRLRAKRGGPSDRQMFMNQRLVDFLYGRELCNITAFNAVFSASVAQTKTRIYCTKTNISGISPSPPPPSPPASFPKKK